MEVKVMLFGQLVDITGTGTLMVKNVRDTNGVVQYLEGLYPSLKGSVYVVAVDKEIIQSNTGLENNMTVALLPPFAGG